MAWVRLFRLNNVLMIGFIHIILRWVLIKPTYASCITLSPIYSDLEYLLLSSLTMLIAAGGYWVNNIYDVEIDRINNPDKNPLLQHISIKNAWIIFHIINLSVLVTTFIFFPLFYVYIHLGSILALWLYSSHLKRSPLVGNIVVAGLSALVLIEIWWIELETLFDYHCGDGNMSILFIILLGYTAFAYLSTLIREIIKDIEDIEGDQKANCNTLPIVIGVKNSKVIALFILVMLGIAILLESYLFYKLNQLPFALIWGIGLFSPIIILFAKIRVAQQKQDFSNISKWLKLYMLFAILWLFWSFIIH